MPEIGQCRPAIRFRKTRRHNLRAITTEKKGTENSRESSGGMKNFSAIDTNNLMRHLKKAGGTPRPLLRNKPPPRVKQDRGF